MCKAFTKGKIVNIVFSVLVKSKGKVFPMMENFLRDPHKSGLGKSIINPSLAKTVWNHGVLSVLNNSKFYDVIVDPKFGKNFHYRDTVQGIRIRQQTLQKVKLSIH